MARLYQKCDKDREFYMCCEKVRRNHKGYLPNKTIAKLGEKSECSSFFLTVNRIKDIIWKINTDRHKESSHIHIREKHDEIYKRYKELLSTYKDKSLMWYAEEISMQSAPRFYYDADYATILYYKLMKKGYD